VVTYCDSPLTLDRRDIGKASSSSLLDLAELQLVCENLYAEEVVHSAQQNKDKEEASLKETANHTESALDSNTCDKDKESDTEQEQVATGDEEKTGEHNATRVPQSGDDM